MSSLKFPYQVLVKSVNFNNWLAIAGKIEIYFCHIKTEFVYFVLMTVWIKFVQCFQ